MAPPTAPSTLPQYLANRLPKQDDETLRDTREYIDQLLADRERCREEPVTKDELPDDVDDAITRISNHERSIHTER